MRRLLLAGAAAALAAAALALGGVVREDGAAARPPTTREFAHAARARTRSSAGARPPDASYLSRSQDALRRALVARPVGSSGDGRGLASLSLSQHRFREALVLGHRAQRLAPDVAPTLGIVGDAQLELGRYEAAFASYDALRRASRGSPRTRASRTRAS